MKNLKNLVDFYVSELDFGFHCIKECIYYWHLLPKSKMFWVYLSVVSALENTSWDTYLKLHEHRSELAYYDGVWAMSASHAEYVKSGRMFADDRWRTFQDYLLEKALETDETGEI